MPLYRYQGSVMQFEKEIARNWKGETFTVSKKKALNNLAFQYKLSHNLARTAKISLNEKNIMEVK